MSMERQPGGGQDCRRQRRQRRRSQDTRSGVCVPPSMVAHRDGLSPQSTVLVPLAVPTDLVSLVMQGHRMFRPELVHQALFGSCTADGRVAPNVLAFYQQFLTPEQIATVYRDLLLYASEIPEDVFGLDPNRYLHIRSGQVVMFQNPLGSPIFVLPSPADNDSVPAAKIAISTDSSSSPPRHDVVLDDAALQLWGYSADQIEHLQRMHLRPPDQWNPYLPGMLSFLMVLFTPASASTIVANRLCAIFFQARHTAFPVTIIRSNGQIVGYHSMLRSEAEFVTKLGRYRCTVHSTTSCRRHI